MKRTNRFALAALATLAALLSLTSEGRAQEVVSSYVRFTDLTTMMTAIPPISGLASFHTPPSTAAQRRILAPMKDRGHWRRTQTS